MVIKPTHITDFLDLHATEKPASLAIVCDERSLSWEELGQQVSTAATQLYKIVGKQSQQQVIGMLFANGWQFIVSYLAILKLGHIALPLDPTFKTMEINAVINQIQPKLIITDSNYLDKVSSSKLPVVQIIQLLESAANLPAEQVLRLDAKDQVASLVFTSGTTGRPKAAPYTHANHLWNIKVCSEAWNWDSNDSLLISLPLSHWYGLVMGLSGIIYHGNTLYLHDWFDEHKTLEALASGKVTMFTHISTIYMRLLDKPGDYDISGVRLCISGGSALPPAIWQKFKDRFGQEILECYGSSESGRIASNLLNERIPGSPGHVLSGVELKFGENNEILIKSEGVFPGYYKNPEATKAATASDGWWRTGDIGELENGRVVLKGRLQERIRRFGYTISPRDIEWAMHNNHEIEEIYVMAEQTPSEPNDRLIYFVVTEISDDQLQSYYKANLPYAWRPDRVIRLGSVPRTRNGKPKIDALRQLSRMPDHV